MVWMHDVLVESDVQRGQPISTTGGHVWDAAVRLVEFLEVMEAELHLKREGLQVLELGAGTGFLAMTVARNLPSARVCVTEMAYGGALEHLQYNVDKNRDRIPLENLTVSACDWSMWRGIDGTSERDEDGGTDGGGWWLADTKWDLIIGSDLIYNEAGVKMLPKVLAGLLAGGGTTAFYCHTKHRFDMMDQDFLENVARAGLDLEETVETGRAMPPPSPPLFESLFSEMRIAVWRITVRKEGDTGKAFVRATYMPQEQAEESGKQAALT